MTSNPKLRRLSENLTDLYSSPSPIEEPSRWLTANMDNIKFAWKDACSNTAEEGITYLQRLIYPRLLAYTLGCIKLTADSKLYMDFKAELIRWNKLSPTTLLRSHRSIKETSWAFQNRCKPNHTNHTTNPVGNDIKKLLRLDVLAIAFQVLAILGNDLSSSKSFYNQRGPNAQTMLDLLLDILDVSDLDIDVVRPSILKVLQELSERSGLYPTSLILNNVEPQGQEPFTKGPHGDIWKGTLAGNAVAIKVMKIDPNFISRGTKLVCKAAVVWRQFRHSNVISFVGVCQWPGSTPRLCLVSPWMKNGNLTQYLRNNPRADIRSLLMDVAQGLDYLHSFDPPIIHGDLRGTNILITPDQYACISDTGLSILARDSALVFTPSATIFQTDNLLWLAPEFLNGHKEPLRRNKATDIYSLGCVYYEAFAGHPRFLEMHDAFEIMNAVLNGSLPEKPTHDALNDAIWDLINMCWQGDAASRPTANAVVQNLISDPTATIDLSVRSPDETSFSLPPVVLRKSIMFQDIIIALIGPTGSGKSNFIRVATGDPSVGVGDDLDSCTQDVQAINYLHATGCNIVFVDTPGFDDTEKTDFEVLEQITEWLNKTYREQITLTGLLFFHRITDSRMRGTPLRILRMFEALCGKDALQNVVLTTTMWDQFESEGVIRLKEERERQLHEGFWKPLLEEGSRTARFRNTHDSAWDIIRLFNINSPVPILEQREVVDEGRRKEDTSAFKVLIRWWDQVLKRAKERFFKKQQSVKRR